LKTIFETERLILREFTEDDFAFIISLVNSDGWLRYIGDRNIHTEAQAKEYLRNGPIKSYKENGYGLSMVVLKAGNIPIGMCGIINRATLEHPDIGFAFLPGFSNKGYGFEIAAKTLKHALEELQIPKVVAITVPENTASIKLLEKIGMSFQEKLSLNDEELLLFGTA